MNNKLSREELIDALLEESIEYICKAMEQGDVALLADYLAYGFVGYEHMSLEELQSEHESNIDGRETK
jgi:hypothetical protein